jgi:hypothetical protein
MLGNSCEVSEHDETPRHHQLTMHKNHNMTSYSLLYLSLLFRLFATSHKLRAA